MGLSWMKQLAVSFCSADRTLFGRAFSKGRGRPLVSVEVPLSFKSVSAIISVHSMPNNVHEETLFVIG